MRRETRVLETKHDTQNGNWSKWLDLSSTTLFASQIRKSDSDFLFLLVGLVGARKGEGVGDLRRGTAEVCNLKNINAVPSGRCDLPPFWP